MVGTYEKVKKVASVSGIVPVINDMFGSNIVCDDAVMFGGQPIDDDLLRQIVKVVCDAVDRGEISRDQGKEIMGVAYEKHTVIDAERADRMIDKGSRLASEVLRHRNARKKALEFCDAWGMDKIEDFNLDVSRALFNERKKALKILGKGLFPELCKMGELSITPELLFVDSKDTDSYAITKFVIRDGKLKTRIFFYLTDETVLSRDGVDVVSTLVHELHHCKQIEDTYNVLMKRNEGRNIWGDEKKAEMMMYIRLSYSGTREAMLNNPVEQEAHSVDIAFNKAFREYFENRGNMSMLQEKIVTRGLRKQSKQQKKIILEQVKDRLEGR